MATELVTVDRRSSAIEQARPQVDPLLAVMDKLANNPSLDADKIERIMSLYIDGQRKMATMEDERIYYVQMAEFKKNPPEVFKTLKAKIQGTTGSGKDYSFEVPYADLNAFADAAMADLAERGITWDFEIVDAGKELSVTCLMHYGLYTRRGSTITGDPATLQSPNAFMKKGAAQSFLMRYSFCASTGLTAALPPDKNGTTLTGKPAPASQGMNPAKVDEFLSSIDGSGAEEELKRNYLAAQDAAKAAGDQGAANQFSEAKNKMYRKLAGGHK